MPRVHHIVIKLIMILTKIHDPTADHGSVFKIKISGSILIADFLTGFNNRLQ